MSNNYKFVKAPPEYPGRVYTCGHRVLEHHLVWWKRTGEVVPDGYEIHHKNGNKANNRFSNLELLPKKVHLARHHPTAKDVKLKCAWCRQELVLKARYVRSKRKTQKRFFCSSAHAALFGSRGRLANRKPRHGTVSEYSHHGCRCQICKKAHRKRCAAWRDSKRGR